MLFRSRMRFLGRFAELKPALKHVLDIAGKYSANRPRNLILITDAQIGNESAILELMRTAPDFPVIRAVALEEKPAPHNPLGAKGAGEGGIIPTGGAIANAVAAALRPLGVEPRELPLSPSRLWELIAAAGAALRDGKQAHVGTEKSLAGTNHSEQDEPAHHGRRLK